MEKQIEVNEKIGNGTVGWPVGELLGRAVRTRIARVRKPVDVDAVVKEQSLTDVAASGQTVQSGTTVTNAAEDREETLQHFVEAAWRFGIAVLWRGEEQTDEETREALGHLDDYFRKADPEEAFVRFVARVMVAETTKKKCALLSPAQWMKRAKREGLLLKLDPKMHASIIKKFPRFDATVRILAKHYLEYIKCPLLKTVLNCSDELQTLGGKSWMKIFYE